MMQWGREASAAGRCPFETACDSTPWPPVFCNVRLSRMLACFSRAALRASNAINKQTEPLLRGLMFRFVSTRRRTGVRRSQRASPSSLLNNHNATWRHLTSFLPLPLKSSWIHLLLLPSPSSRNLLLFAKTQPQKSSLQATSSTMLQLKPRHFNLSHVLSPTKKPSSSKKATHMRSPRRLQAIPCKRPTHDTHDPSHADPCNNNDPTSPSKMST